MTRGTATRGAALAAALATLLLAPSAQAFFHHDVFAVRGPGPMAGDNGMSTAFGDLSAPMNATYRAAPVLVETTLRLNASGADAFRVMLAFVVTNPNVDVTFVSARQGGTDLPFEVDHRIGRQPSAFVLASNLSAREPIRMRALVEPSVDGRHQVGALAVGFDREWHPIDDREGELAQLYAYTYVGATGLSEGAAPPFEGRGNALPLWPLPIACVVLLLGLLIATRWREPGPEPGTRTP